MNPSTNISLLRVMLITFTFGFSLMNLCAQSDTAVVIQTDEIKSEEEKEPGFGSLFKGPPGKAFLYSAILPGAGQFYNKRYWKVPIVYAAIGTTVWILIDNRNEFERFDEAYRMRVDLGDDSMDEFQGILTLSRINNFRQVWRKNVQRTYIALGLIYLIQASEAFVDRHLMEFDVSDDLSLDFRWHAAPNRAGITCHFQKKQVPQPINFGLH